MPLSPRSTKQQQRSPIHEVVCRLAAKVHCIPSVRPSVCLSRAYELLKIGMP